MEIQAVTDLVGGACTLVGTPHIYRIRNGQFYAADLEFSNGQHVKGLPTYVPLSADQSLAKEVAIQAGNIAAQQGHVDVYALIENNTLPFVDLLLASAENKHQELVGRFNNSSLSHYVHLSQRAHNSAVQFLFSNRGKQVGGISLAIPNGDNLERLERYLKQTCRERWVHTNEISHLKVHTEAQTNAVQTNDTPITILPKTESLVTNPWRVNYTFTNEPSFAISLGTKDQQIAEMRADALWERCRQLLHEQGSFTRAELKEYIETLKETIPDTQAVEHQPKLFLGPIKIAYPNKDVGSKTYVKWTSSTLGASFTSLDGNSNSLWGSISLTVSDELGLSSAQKAKLKDNLWSFIHDRLAQAISDGYRFRLVTLDDRGNVTNQDPPTEFQPQLQGIERTLLIEQADLQLTFTPAGSIGFTPQGYERLKLDVLQGRLDGTYLVNALASGYDNPFDIRIPEDKVRQLRLHHIDTPAQRISEANWSDRVPTRSVLPDDPHIQNRTGRFPSVPGSDGNN